MTTAVKICGLKTADAMETALAHGADFVGLVFYPPSPRSLSPDAAGKLAELARARAHNSAQIVALVVDADDGLLQSIMTHVRPDLWQLHGSETASRRAEIKARFGVAVMTVFKVATAADAEMALDCAACDRILFDAKAPKGLVGALPGGNGLSFDWRMLEGVKGRLDFMLSGGLTAENVAEAIRRTGASAVDVSSGVESTPGEKDPGLIVKFLAAAKSA